MQKGCVGPPSAWYDGSLMLRHRCYHPTMTLTFERQTTIRLRPKNQVTIPDVLAKRLGVEPGDRLFASFVAPDTVVLRRVPRSYAGTFADVWPDVEEATQEIRATRDGWEERTRDQLGR